MVHTKNVCVLGSWSNIRENMKRLGCEEMKPNVKMQWVDSATEESTVYCYYIPNYALSADEGTNKSLHAFVTSLLLALKMWNKLLKVYKLYFSHISW